jgi:flagellin
LADGLSAKDQIAMTVIASNTAALRAQNATNKANMGLQQAMERLSTGKRINSAKDDAAGLAIATKMTAEIRGLTAAVRNANDGISLTQVAEGAMGEVSNILQRMRELAVQASSGTVSDTDRAGIQKEVEQLKSQVTDIATRTSFNGISMLNGSTSATTPVTIAIQTGTNSGERVDVTIDAVNLTALGLAGTVDLNADGDTSDSFDANNDGDTSDTGVDISEAAYDLDVSTQQGAELSLEVLEAAINTVSAARATLGGIQSRLETTVNSLTSQVTNLSEARSRIEDADFSEESTALAKNQILSQASTAMLAQANQSQQGVLSLLR